MNTSVLFTLHMNNLIHLKSNKELTLQQQNVKPDQFCITLLCSRGTPHEQRD